MTTPITTTTQLATPDPSPTVLALAQALATVDGNGWAFTSTTKSVSSAGIVNDYIGDAEKITAHLPGPTIKPGREEVAKEIYGDARTPWDHLPAPAKDYWLSLADAVLAILPGKTEAQVRAEALRDAKARIALDFTFSGHEVAAWLDALADEEAGK